MYHVYLGNYGSSRPPGPDLFYYAYRELSWALELQQIIEYEYGNVAYIVCRD